MGRGKNIWRILKAASLVAVLGLLYFVLRSIGFRKIIGLIRGMNAPSFYLAAGLVICVFLLWSFRLQLMMPRRDRGSILLLFPIYMAGVFGNVITPGARVGGEPIRAYYMAEAFGGPKTGHLGVLIADKLGNLAVFMTFLLISVSFVALFVPLRPLFKFALEGAVLLIIGAIVSGVLLRKHIGFRSGLLNKLVQFLYHEPVVGFFRSRFKTYQHFEDYVIRKLDNVFSPIASAAKSPKALTKVILISGAAWLVYYFAHYILFQALGADLSFFAVFIIVTISTFCGDLAFSPGGAGFMEAIMIGLCAAFGLEQETAAAVTLVSRGIFYFCGIGIGGASFGTLALLYGRAEKASTSGGTGEASADGET